MFSSKVEARGFVDRKHCQFPRMGTVDWYKGWFGWILGLGPKVGFHSLGIGGMFKFNALKNSTNWLEDGAQHFVWRV
jgi:hypothetical protein